MDAIFFISARTRLSFQIGFVNKKALMKTSGRDKLTFYIFLLAEPGNGCFWFEGSYLPIAGLYDYHLTRQSIFLINLDIFACSCRNSQSTVRATTIGANPARLH